MSPQVVAAIIAGALTVIGTLAAQIYGRRVTGRDTEETLKAQGEQLDRTLADQRQQLDRTFVEQRDQLDKTLTAQSDQLKQTLAEQRTRTLNERFSTAADKLGADKPAAVRLAGVYAMAGLADDWEENRQTCVDVLCGYLRMPYDPDPGEGKFRLVFLADREVRHTVIRVITAHLRDGAGPSWQGRNFDFTGVVFDGGDFRHAKFSGGRADFDSAKFSGDEVTFGGAEFCGGTVSFGGAEFSGGDVNFGTAKFSGGEVHFKDAKFSGGEVDFAYATFSGGTANFRYAEFSGGRVSFYGVELSGGAVFFSRGAGWSFPWTDTPPPGVKLPGKEDQSQAQGSAD